MKIDLPDSAIQAPLVTVVAAAIATIFVSREQFIVMLNVPLAASFQFLAPNIGAEFAPVPLQEFSRQKAEARLDQEVGGNGSSGSSRKQTIVSNELEEELLIKAPPDMLLLPLPLVYHAPGAAAGASEAC